jgi:pilus assembly protein CpaE
MSMHSKPIALGILSPLRETRSSWRTLPQATNIASIAVEGGEYCAEIADRAARRFIEAMPEVILVDMQDAEVALRALRVLHEALPDTWLLVSSTSVDSQLIIRTMQAGAREFLPHPVSPPSLASALGRYLTERQKGEERKPRGKIYIVTAAKGGAGSTSVAINLAFSLASASGAKVALFDFAYPIGDVAGYINLKSEFTVADALASASRLDAVLLETYMSHNHGVAVLPGRKEFPAEVMPSEALSEILEVAIGAYTHVFVDMFCAYEPEQFQAVASGSEALIIVMTPELPALWRTDRLIQRLEASGTGDKIKLVLNRDSKQHEISGREIEKMLHFPVYYRLPNNYPAAIQAVNSGKPLITVNHSSLAASYFELAQMLTGVPLGSKRKGIIGLFS